MAVRELPKKLQEDLLRYTDSVGLLQNKTTPPGTVASGNGVLVTGLAVALLHRLEALDPYRSLFGPALGACEREPGLLMRHPLWPEDQESSDDYVGLGAGSYFLKLGIAARVLARGRKHRFKWLGIPLPFYLDNERGNDAQGIDWRAFIGRFFSTTAHLQFSDEETPGPIDQILHAATIAALPWKNEDEPTLSWLMCEVAAKQSMLVALASLVLRLRIYLKYRGGMAKIFAITYGAEHPLTQLALLAEV